MGRITRRTFFKGVAAGAAAIHSSAGWAERRRIYPWAYSEENYVDEVTGTRIHVLTPDTAKSHVIYQTHPMWVQNMDYLVFHGLRDGESVPHAKQMNSGLVRPLLAEEPGPVLVVPEQGSLLAIMGGVLYTQSVLGAFQKLHKPMKVCNLPEEIQGTSGGMSLDASGKILYVGAILEPDSQWAIMAVSLQTLAWSRFVEAPFRIGHIQAHPFRNATVMYCHETGGDAPQRMFIKRSDEEYPRPYFKEWYDEWVTHEVWWGNGRALFTIWPYNEEWLKGTYGILSVDLRGVDKRVHAKYKAWHCHGSSDGKRILGDDFDRNIWLIHPHSGERRLLTQGHNGPDFETHPHASFTPDNNAVVFNSSRNGKEQVFVAEIPDWESLPVAAPPASP